MGMSVKRYYPVVTGNNFAYNVFMEQGTDGELYIKEKDYQKLEDEKYRLLSIVADKMEDIENLESEKQWLLDYICKDEHPGDYKHIQHSIIKEMKNSLTNKGEK